MIALLVALAVAAQQPPGGLCMGPPPGGSPFGARPVDGGLAERYDDGSYDPVLRAQGMSAAGVAALHSAAGQRDDPAFVKMRTTAADRSVREAAAVSPVDVAQLGRALHQRDLLATRDREEHTRRLLAALAVLTPADRAVLLSLVGTGETGPGGMGGPSPGGPPGGMGGPPPGFGGPAGPPPGCHPGSPH